MSEIRDACPVIAFMVQQVTTEPGVGSDFLRAVEHGSIHVCCDLDPVHAPTARVAKRDLGSKIAKQAPPAEHDYSDWASRNLR